MIKREKILVILIFGKLGNGTLIATKIVANVGIFALSTMAEMAGNNAKTIINNPNANSEQLRKAQEIECRSREILKNLNKDRRSVEFLFLTLSN